MATFYHWDRPQVLEDRGGWTVRETAEHFADYATVVHDRLGDRVGSWTTLNEPWCSAYLGYGSGRHAPGRRDPAAAFAAVHHLLLAHGLGVQALRAAGARSVGLVVNPAVVRPADPDSTADTAAARLIDGLHNRVFLDPVFGGGYPGDILAHISRFGDPWWLAEGDEKTIAASIDQLGVNYYAPTYVAARPGADGGDGTYPGSEGIEFLSARIARDYPGIPLWVTENGAAFDDRVDGDRIADQVRIGYLDSHLRAARAALDGGVDLRGYLVWSLLDNFEWAEGYHKNKRFGLVHVDFPAQRRTPKDSADWYRSVIAGNALPEPD